MARSIRDLEPGESAVLTDNGLPDAVRRRLVEMGLRPGEQVTVVQKAVGGARVLAVHGSRIALDGRTAGQLTVQDAL